MKGLSEREVGKTDERITINEINEFTLNEINEINEREWDRRGSRSPAFPHINMSEIARDVGLSRAQVSRILNGKSSPSIGAAIKIAARMDLTVERLMATITNRGTAQ